MIYLYMWRKRTLDIMTINIKLKFKIIHFSFIFLSSFIRKIRNIFHIKWIWKFQDCSCRSAQRCFSQWLETWTTMLFGIYFHYNYGFSPSMKSQFWLISGNKKGRWLPAGSPSPLIGSARWLPSETSPGPPARFPCGPPLRAPTDRAPRWTGLSTTATGPSPPPRQSGPPTTLRSTSPGSSLTSSAGWAGPSPGTRQDPADSLV